MQDVKYILRKWMVEEELGRKQMHLSICILYTV